MREHREEMVIVMTKKVKINEIKLDDALVKKIEKYGFTVEDVFGKVIEKAMWKAINSYTKGRCDKCGKVLAITVVPYNRKAMRERGELCECSKKKG